MTPQEEMQKIVESADECWHESSVFGDLAICTKCKGNFGINPSPTDLNELFRLAGKLGFDEIRIDLGGACDVIRWRLPEKRFAYSENYTSESDALRKALVEAIGDENVQ
jgi:hypothetical protein